MNNDKFTIGDRVVCTYDHPDGNSNIIIGSTGTVCHINYYRKGLVGVRWDKRLSIWNSCGGTCDDGHGWYVAACRLEYDVPAEDNSDIYIDDVVFNSFLLEKV